MTIALEGDHHTGKSIISGYKSCAIQHFIKSDDIDGPVLTPKRLEGVALEIALSNLEGIGELVFGALPDSAPRCFREDGVGAGVPALPSALPPDFAGVRPG